MSCIVYQTDRKTGNVHAYSSVSHRDPVTKKVKTAKTYLGRVDPVTNEIIPKAKIAKYQKAFEAFKKAIADIDEQD